jgi:hypothetical protein
LPALAVSVLRARMEKQKALKPHGGTSHQVSAVALGVLLVHGVSYE